MTASIVISTINRPKLIFEAVEALANVIPNNTEIIIVDAGVDKPVIVGDLLTIWPRCIVLNSPYANISIQRNTGVQSASGEICLILDDDAIVQAGWYDAMLKPFEDPQVGAVAGAIWCNPSPTFTDARGGYVTWYGDVVQTIHRSHNSSRHVDWPNGGNVAVRRKLFLDMGGFGEVFSFYDEDVDFGLRLRKAGYIVVFQPDGVVHHFFGRQPHKPTTKRRIYVAGRSRGAMLVRNYGFLGPTLICFVLAPLRALIRALLSIIREIWRHFGYAVAQLVGLFVGAWLGIRFRVRDDVKRLRSRSVD